MPMKISASAMSYVGMLVRKKAPGVLTRFPRRLIVPSLSICQIRVSGMTSRVPSSWRPASRVRRWRSSCCRAKVKDPLEAPEDGIGELQQKDGNRECRKDDIHRTTGSKRDASLKFRRRGWQRIGQTTLTPKMRA